MNLYTLSSEEKVDALEYLIINTNALWKASEPYYMGLKAQFIHFGQIYQEHYTSGCLWPIHIINVLQTER